MIYFNKLYNICVSHLKGDKYALLCMCHVSNWRNPHEKLSLHFLWNGWKNGELKIKPWFYNHPQHCDNIAHTLSGKTIHHKITIFCNILIDKLNLLTTWEKYMNVAIFFHSLDVIELEPFQKLTHHISSGFPNTQKQ